VVAQAEFQLGMYSFNIVTTNIREVFYLMPLTRRIGRDTNPVKVCVVMNRVVIIIF
jgi:hypothetical protein